MLPEVDVAASRCAKLRKDDVEPVEAKSKVGGDGSILRSEVTVSNSKIDGFKVRSYKYGGSLLFDRFFGLLLRTHQNNRTHTFTTA